MATAAQINANRKNAQKSTGPKTENGKARARLNALTHGLSARTVIPVLPHEDPKKLEERIRTWTEDWQPRNAIETELVSPRHGCRGCSSGPSESRRPICPTACARPSAAGRVAASGRRHNQVDDLGRKLFYLVEERTKLKPGPPWDDPPAAFVRELEKIPEGCRWLLDRWGEFRALIDKDGGWASMDLFRFIRLLGKQPIEGVIDPALNAILLAWDVDLQGFGREFWERSQGSRSTVDPGYSGLICSREIAHRPDNKAEAVAILSAVVDKQVERLKELLAEHEQFVAKEAAERADRAAFDPSPGFERHRRYRTALAREFLRTLDTLRKMQSAEGQVPEVEDHISVGHDSDRLIHQEEPDKNGSLSHGSPWDTISTISSRSTTSTRLESCPTKRK